MNNAVHKIIISIMGILISKYGIYTRMHYFFHFVLILLLLMIPILVVAPLRAVCYMQLSSDVRVYVIWFEHTYMYEIYERVEKNHKSNGRTYLESIDCRLPPILYPYVVRNLNIKQKVVLWWCFNTLNSPILMQEALLMVNHE